MNIRPITIDLLLNLSDGGLVPRRLEEMAVAALPLQVLLDRSVSPGHISMGHGPIRRFFQGKDAGLYCQAGIITGLFWVVEPTCRAGRMRDEQFWPSQLFCLEELISK